MARIVGSLGHFHSTKLAYPRWLHWILSAPITLPVAKGNVFLQSEEAWSAGRLFCIVVFPLESRKSLKTFSEVVGLFDLIQRHCPQQQQLQDVWWRRVLSREGRRQEDHQGQGKQILDEFLLWFIPRVASYVLQYVMLYCLIFNSWILRGCHCTYWSQLALYIARHEFPFVGIVVGWFTC